MCSRLCFSLPSSIYFACVAEQQKLLTVNQASLRGLRRCESYHMHQSSRKGSLTGKAVVPKTTALVACRFDSCPFLQFTEASPNWYGSGLLNRRAPRVRMQVRLLSPPPDSCGVAELERRESLKLVYVGSNPTSVANLYRCSPTGMRR